jgi:hydroxymethylpyrimidine/phosphomethylpyrimidine kinase
MPSSPPVVLTIAGFDPSSGAGVTADIKTIAAHGCYGIACLTALTIQSTSRVAKVEPIAPETIRETLDELSADIDISAVHIGMLGDAAAAQIVAEFLHGHSFPHVVLDPILKSSSGAALLDDQGLQVLKEELLPLADVLTPNAEEAGILSGLRIQDAYEMRAAAAKLHAMGCRATVITGGDLAQIVDLLSVSESQGLQQREFASDRIESNSTHGTGCAFSTALACNLAQGKDLPTAVALAQRFVRSAIAAAYPVGKGKGPLHHLHGTNIRGKSRDES